MTRRRDREREKARMRERYATDPEYRARERARGREYQKRPEVVARRREYGREYRQRPEVRARKRERDREYRKQPRVREYERKRALARYHRKGGDGYQRWRGTLLMEQAFACALCGETITAKTAHVDHIVPVSKWPEGKPGLNSKKNLQAACPACNLRKGDAS